jgi:hypothetical protein
MQLEGSINELFIAWQRSADTTYWFDLASSQLGNESNGSLAKEDKAFDV